MNLHIVTIAGKLRRLFHFCIVFFSGKVIDILSSLPKQLENIENYEKSNFCYCFGILENFSDESFALATVRIFCRTIG